ncbi:MAG: hypothetical protein LBV17_00365 [Treponema sp.]|jgi:hypothetical protein|nr:hypothetical protein [Treponema sp.]
MLFFSVSAIYAANKKNITLNIQGTGSQSLVDGFIHALKIEANAAGYDVTDNIAAAKYYIKFTIEFDQAEQRSRFNVSLVRVQDSNVIVTMEYLFADEEEMLLYSQLVFFMLMANLPEDEVVAAAPEDDTWRNKWLYLRTSFDYSLMCLALKSDDLIGGSGIYNDAVNPPLIAPLDNKIVPVMGAKLGAEVQFLDFMSLEPGVQLSLEEVVQNYKLYNILLSAELKFPLKFLSNLVIEPYGAVAYPMRFPKENDIFASMPLLSYGGGIQASVKGGKNGAIFFEASYMYYGDVSMKNHYDELYTKPEVIHYDHFVLSFKAGYKFGFFDRKKKGS